MYYVMLIACLELLHFVFDKCFLCRSFSQVILDFSNVVNSFCFDSLEEDMRYAWTYSDWMKFDTLSIL